MNVSIQQASQANQPTTNRPLVMREGQLFRGKINQLYPNQTAQIQIGSEKMVAKLEVPMKAGDAHYFQVTATEPELRLKVVSDPLPADQKQSIQTLMKQLNLPITKEIQAVLKHALQGKVPMSKDQMIAAAEVMKRLPTVAAKEVMQAVSRLVELRLPIQVANVQSFVALQNKESLHPSLQDTLARIQEDPSISTKQKAVIEQSIRAMSRPIDGATTSLVRAEALERVMGTPSPLRNEVVAQLLQKLEPMPMQRAQAEEAHRFLQHVQTLFASSANGRVTPVTPEPTHPGHSQPSTMGTTQGTPVAVNEQGAILRALQSMITQSETLSEKTVQQLRQVIEQQEMKAPSQVVVRLLETLAKGANAVTKEFPFQPPSTERLLTLDRLPTSLVDRIVQTLSEGERSLITAKTNEQLLQKLDGVAFQQLIKQSVASLGMNYEAVLSKGDRAEIAQLMNQMKPQLVQLLQEGSLQPATREAVESLVARMNAPLLHSGDQGLQHQLVMNVPLQFLNKRIDATLQWNGRLEEDGTFNEDFARILFYLQLEAIEETVVDMQVQNRIVTVTIYNGNQIEPIGKMLEHTLKEGLEKENYRLSAVHFKPLEEREMAPKEKVNNYAVKVKTSGVDFTV